MLLVIVSFFLIFFGLGQIFYSSFPLAIVTGILLNFLISLILLKTNATWIAVIAFALIGIIHFFIKLIKKNIIISLKPDSFFIAFLFCFFGTLVFFQIFESPIGGYDPSGIWFLHAKMIFLSRTLGLESGWNHPAIFSFSHTDYPLLFSSLCAQFTTQLNLWNGYIPKVSLLFLYTPALCILLSFKEKQMSFVFLLLICLINFSGYFGSGFMDGYVCLYIMLAVLLFHRCELNRNNLDFSITFMCLGIAASLKNEGILFYAGFLISFAAFNFEAFKKIPKKAFIISILPILIWAIYKKSWGLHNYIQLNTQSGIHALKNRLFNPAELKLILNAMLVKNHPLRDALCIFLALIATLVFTRNKKSFFNKKIQIILSSLIFYYFGVFSAYLLTPFELDWHLMTSVDRTTLSPTQGLLLLVYFILLFYENKAKNTAIIQL